MKRLSLSQRLSAVFAALLLACCGASLALQYAANERHGQEVIQRLSSGLAAHMAANAALMAPNGVAPAAAKDLFGKLMDVNPSVEVYLLGADGRIEAQDAPPGHLKRDRVDLAPIRRLLAGEPLPILGDDPRSPHGRKVFNAAPLRVGGREAGYLYVVLLGEDHDALAQHVAEGGAWRTTLWSMALVAGLGLVAGLLAFRWITRPLQRLTDDVRRFQADGMDVPPGAPADAPPAAPVDGPAAPGALAGIGGPPGAAASSASAHEIARPERTTVDGPAPVAATGGDEIAMLRQAFAEMTRRIAAQWRELNAQDQQRRELVANISHDLRTPLTSLHGYLETLKLKAGTLSPADRERYLDVALGQSRKVGRLAQELFELARLECGVVKPDKEPFSLAELVQDVFQKFELAAEARQQRLTSHIDPGLPTIRADLGLIERVLTNLLDNAIRHTPTDGRIDVRLSRDGTGVEVQVSDTGPGIAPALKAGLFDRPSFQSGLRSDAGGLGLVIVRRILQLHGSDIRLLAQTGPGAVFSFRLCQ